MKIGITGHQDLIDDSHEIWIKNSIDSIIETLKPDIGISCLAKGSDQLFAQAILNHGIYLLSIIPCENYVKTFDASDVDRYLNLLGKSSSIVKMSFSEPSQEAFLSGGIELVNRSETIIAVWNGKKAKGLGGTADIIKYAIKQDKPVIHLDLINKQIQQISKESIMANKRIFISFAIEDVLYRDFLKGQARNEKCPFEFTDMSAKEAWDEKWKTNCRIRIKGCDGVIALLSKNTAKADGEKWEMNCANEEKIPMIGVHIHKDDKGAIPSELSGKKVIEWSWEGIKKFIDSL